MATNNEISPTAEPQLARKRTTGSIVTRFGWRLFKDDLRSGRLVDLLLLGVLAMLTVNFATARSYVVDATSLSVVGSKSLTQLEAGRISGLLGKSIFEVDAAHPADGLQASPYVRSLHIETRLPNIVRVVVDERRPGVVWVRNRVPYLVEEDGSIIGTASTLDGFVVVYDRDAAQPAQPSPVRAASSAANSPGKESRAEQGGGDYRVGGHLSVLATEGLDSAQRIFMLLPASGLNMVRIEYNADRGVSVVTSDNQVIIFGSKDEIDLKIKICKNFLRQSAGKVWVSMDLRSTTHAAVQMRGGEKK